VQLTIQMESEAANDTWCIMILHWIVMVLMGTAVSTTAPMLVQVLQIWQAAMNTKRFVLSDTVGSGLGQCFTSVTGWEKVLQLQRSADPPAAGSRVSIVLYKLKFSAMMG
jgi:hypothetical protein